MFRCDRITSAEAAEGPDAPERLDLRDVHLGSWEEHLTRKPALLDGLAELTPLGVEACEDRLDRRLKLHVREDGSGRLKGSFPAGELSYPATFFIGLGHEALWEKYRSYGENLCHLFFCISLLVQIVHHLRERTSLEMLLDMVTPSFNFFHGKGRRHRPVLIILHHGFIIEG
mgnify:CR=1 FL=1